MLTTSLITSAKMAKILKNDLEKIFDIDFKLHECKGNENTTEVKSYPIYKNLQFLSWLYQESNIYLNRKKEKFKNIIKIYNDFND